MNIRSRLDEYIREYPFLMEMYHTNHVLHQALMEAAHKDLDSISMIQHVMEKQSAYVEEFIQREMMRSSPVFRA